MAFGFDFQNFDGEMCVLKNHAKSKVFQINKRPQAFFVKFDVKLGSWGMINTGDRRPLEVSTKYLQLPPGSSAGFTPRAQSAVGWTGYQKCPSIFFILCGYMKHV